MATTSHVEDMNIFSFRVLGNLQEPAVCCTFSGDNTRHFQGLFSGKEMKVLSTRCEESAPSRTRRVDRRSNL